MDIELRHPESIASVPHEQWADATRDGSLWSTPQWLRSVEDGFSPQRKYALAETGAMVAYGVGADTYQEFNPHHLLCREESIAGLAEHRTEAQNDRLGELAAGLPAELVRSATVSVVPWGFTSGLWSSDAGTRASLIDELEGISREWRTPTTGVLYVREDDRQLRDMLVERGYTEILAAANCVLDVPEAGFDAYLAGLHSSRRAKVRREIRNFGGTGIEFRLGTLSEHIDQVAHLCAALQARHGHGYAPELEAKRLLNLERFGQPYIRLAVAERPDGKLAGFLVHFVKDGVLYPKQAGFDSEAADREYLYFNLGYYEMIRQAEAQGLRHIEYGTGAYQAKAIRGCSLQRLYCYLDVPDECADTVREMAELISGAQARMFDSFRRFSGNRSPA